MEEVCQYDKFGICKHRNQCGRKHFPDICETRHTCKSVRKCDKRHPKLCQKFANEGFCPHGEECAYHHPYHQSRETNERRNDVLEERVKYLEDTVASLKLIIFNLQGQVLDIAENSSDQKEDIETSEKHRNIKSKTFDSEEKGSLNKTTVTPENKIVTKPSNPLLKNVFGWEDNEIDLLNYWANKGKEDKKNKVKSNDFSVKEGRKNGSYFESDKTKINFRCYSCSYKCERRETLQKHVNTKHEGFSRDDHGDGGSRAAPI